MPEIYSKIQFVRICPKMTIIINGNKFVIRDIVNSPSEGRFQAKQVFQKNYLWAKNS